ncbi:hypothetical protein FGO68_gene5606 [Halteria grandinella]|uniref:Uncharacterized protein n=1 Tax=Halteria grandinella TaxID=5974 RepID=A0A8J8NEX4_HALGN|nr:hypothetical protein FGO68_gene5606 [Halteria grandinella]
MQFSFPRVVQQLRYAPNFKESLTKVSLVMLSKMINYNLKVSILCCDQCPIVYVNKAQEVAHNILYKACFKVLQTLEGLIVLSPHFLSCFRDKVAVIDGIRQISTDCRCGIKCDVFNSIDCAHVCIFEVSYCPHGVYLKVARIIGAIKRPRHVIVPIEAIQGTHHIVHKDQLRSGTQGLLRALVIADII